MITDAATASFVPWKRASGETMPEWLERYNKRLMVFLGPMKITGEWYDLYEKELQKAEAAREILR